MGKLINGVKEGDYSRVGGNEGTRGHVGTEHCRLVLLDFGSEELVPAEVVEEVTPVCDGSYDGDTIGSWYGFQWEIRL